MYQVASSDKLNKAPSMTCHSSSLHHQVLLASHLHQPKKQPKLHKRSNKITKCKS